MDKHLNDLIIDNRDSKDLGDLIKKPNKTGFELSVQEALQRRVDEKDHLSHLRKYGLPVVGGAKTSRYEQQATTDNALIDAYRSSKKLPRHY